MKKLPQTELHRIAKAGQLLFSIISIFLISFMLYVYFFL